MSFTLDEALWLRELGFKDILVGYPTVDSASITKLATDPSEITLMVNKEEDLKIIESEALKTKKQSPYAWILTSHCNFRGQDSVFTDRPWTMRQS